MEKAHTQIHTHRHAHTQLQGTLDLGSNYSPPLQNPTASLKKKLSLCLWKLRLDAESLWSLKFKGYLWIKELITYYRGALTVSLLCYSDLNIMMLTPHESLWSNSPLGPVMTGRWCCVNAVPREEVCEGEGLLKPDFSDFFSVVGDGMPGKKGWFVEATLIYIATICVIKKTTRRVEKIKMELFVNGNLYWIAVNLLQEQTVT